jgi:uncharacterized membrane protein YeaQ/YmgE (transglycosylase-associated protein family)
MVPMLVIAGILVAWLAQIPAKSRGYGFLADMACGLVGSACVGALIVGLGGDPGMVVMFWIGIVGSFLALAAQRRLWAPADVRP